MDMFLDEEVIHHTDAVILDIRGGTSASRDRGQPSRPAEMLLLDRFGNLIIHREDEDRPAIEDAFPE